MTRDGKVEELQAEIDLLRRDLETALAALADATAFLKGAEIGRDTLIAERDRLQRNWEAMKRAVAVDVESEGQTVTPVLRMLAKLIANLEKTT